INEIRAVIDRPYRRTGATDAVFVQSRPNNNPEVETIPLLFKEGSPRKRAGWLQTTRSHLIDAAKPPIFSGALRDSFITTPSAPGQGGFASFCLMVAATPP